MRIDFHTHGKLAKKLPFSPEYTDWLFGEARRAGLDALCLTEHFNTLGFAQLYGHVSSIGRKTGDAFELPNGLRVFPGMETAVAEGGHILSIGPMDAILELNRRLEPNKAPGAFLPFAELMDLFDQYPVYVGCAHPFRSPGHVPEQPAEQLKRLSFLDLNGKDMAEDPKRTEKLTRAMAKKLSLPVVSGSDTHQAIQYGCISTVLKSDCTTFRQLMDEIGGGHYSIELSKDPAGQVRRASSLKKRLKDLYARGGDYVAALTGGAAV